MKKLHSFIFVLFVSQALHSQSNKLDKKLEKTYELVEKGKLKEADEHTEKILSANPEYGKGWDLLAKIRYKEYQDSKASDNLLKNMTVTTKDKNGKQSPKDDSLTKAFTDLLSNLSLSKIAYNKYTYTLRKAMLTSDDAYLSSALLRNIFIDVDVDTLVSKKALKHFNEAEEEFAKKNYDNAAKIYKRAIEEQPNFYKANMYMGDCFYFTGNYESAVGCFREAINQHPNLLEPRKYIIDTYLKAHLYDKAIDDAIDAMTVYPDLSIAVKMEDAVYYSQKKIDIKWLPREVFPNKIKQDSLKSTLNDYNEPKTPEVKGIWISYKNSLSKIKPFCNEKGIINRTNSLTASKYMEVFAWEEMLKNSASADLEQAKKMQKDGFLDCYVLVTCFHYDFYDQYKDFAKANKNKIREYYKKYIVEKN
ncbi:MAG: tetratricopeptide repeat protein [Bacteroidetes bacterium]|nr:tetratricopeptide repeat protein [Bacteroidota bacterium]